MAKSPLQFVFFACFVFYLHHIFLCNSVLYTEAKIPLYQFEAYLIMQNYNKIIYNEVTPNEYCVLVLATNIDSQKMADKTCKELYKIEGVRKVNVDLEYWQNILRIECASDTLAKKICKVIACLNLEFRELI